MKYQFDVIIVGSGPSGVSAAFPLLKSGLKVLMLDAGAAQSEINFLSDDPYLVSRNNDPEQWKWMIGENFYALQNMDNASPKLRIPTHEHVFKDFAFANKIDVDKEILAIGSLAPGGLSNAWGAGVACLTSHEFDKFPFSYSEIVESYKSVIERIGISGDENDDLSEYFGINGWGGRSSISLDPIAKYLLSKYQERRLKIQGAGMKLGRSRVAVLTGERSGRMGCTKLGKCLWGCPRRAIYSSVEDLKILKTYPGFTYISGFVVDRVLDGGVPTVFGTNIINQKKQTFNAKKILLGAGTIATTRLALLALNYYDPVRVMSSPTAAFMIWTPSNLTENSGQNFFGLGQLSYSLTINDQIGFGSLFSTSGIPTSEFIRSLPMSKRYGSDFLKVFLGSCMVGNLFLPGDTSLMSAQLEDGKGLKIKGRYDESVGESMRSAKILLRRLFMRLNSLLLPGSFRVGRPGSDIHYAGTLPMSEKAGPNTTGKYGELFGNSSIHVIDGACLPLLTEKSHTLTIMANADRISRKIVKDLYNGI